MKGNDQNITLSVCMITYNHEQFISQALDSILMQKTDFPIEIVIGEDCSTDNTREICISYKEKYPDIIKLNLPEKNQGPQPNFLNTFSLCTGKYIALCEGDDYWTDENKLQRQVDFLEQNTDFEMSSHHSVILGHNKKMLYDPPLTKTTFTTTDLLVSDWGIMTASIVFRKNGFEFPHWFVNIKNGDYALQLLLSLKGKIGYIPEYMSVYRRHLGGATAIFDPFYSIKALYNLFHYFNIETGNKFKNYTKKKLLSVYKKSIDAAKSAGLRRQVTGISLLYYSSKIGLNLYPLISKIAFFTKKQKI